MYILRMESSQLITILFLILGALAAGIFWLARQLGKTSTGHPSQNQDHERVQFERDQMELDLVQARTEITGLRNDLQQAIADKSKAEQKFEDHSQEHVETRIRLSNLNLDGRIVSAVKERQQLVCQGKQRS